MGETILVTDGDQRSALALVRTFGRAGHRVFVAGPRARNLAGASRYCAGQARLPDPLAAPAEYVDALASRNEAWRCTTIVPVTEPALLAVLGARERFTGGLIPFPTLERVEAICDKPRVLAAAATLGIAVPAQRLVPTAAEASEAAEQYGSFPVVIKPGRSVSGGASGRTRQSVRFAANRGELAAALARIPASAYPVLLQQRITGPGVGVFLLRHEGRTVASFAHRRLREKPPSGGVSVYAESIALPPALLAQSESLLARFEWSGVAMVEFKLDAATGIPHLMEINGRFWGSLQLAIDAGVDFPNHLLACARGRVPEAIPAYRTGVRLRWWWGDIDHLIARVRHSNRRLNLGPADPGRWKTIGQVLWPWRPGDRPETFRLQDPGPFVRETINWFRGR